jgi:drug/metabolite transporter (DMT)-like permease
MALTKRFVGQYRPRELAGVLLVLNCLLVLPLCATVGDWHLDGRVLALHGASIAVLLASTACVFGLMSHGSATSVALVQALSPLPAVLLAGALLATAVDPVRVLAAVVLTLAVVVPLRGAFATLSGPRAAVLVVAGAVTTAALTVLTKMLLDEGLGMIEIYAVRTGVAGLIAVAVFWPRTIGARALPGLALRAAAMTVFFLLAIAALAHGDAATVQATVATTPLILAVSAAVRWRAAPAPSVVVAVVAAPLAIAVLAA